jgi:hypothetical protein
VIREHYEAVKALIPAHFTVYLFDVPSTPAFPYVVLWGDAGAHGSVSLDPTPREISMQVRATCVGTTYESCLVVLEGVRSALNRARPVVAGRKVHELVQEPLLMVQPDRDVTVPGTSAHPIYAVDGYSLLSEPARLT